MTLTHIITTERERERERESEREREREREESAIVKFRRYRGIAGTRIPIFSQIHLSVRPSRNGVSARESSRTSRHLEPRGMECTRTRTRDFLLQDLSVEKFALGPLVAPGRGNHYVVVNIVTTGTGPESGSRKTLAALASPPYPA